MKRTARKKAPRKKAARKKVVRKKAARRKAARKTAKRRPRKVARLKPRKVARSRHHKVVKKKKKPKPKKVTIHLSDPDGPDNSDPTLMVPRKDKIRWKNDSSQTRTLTFAVWIFEKAAQSIVVKPKKHSRWFTIAAGTPYPATYGYQIDPDFLGTQGTVPDPPQVSADG